VGTFISAHAGVRWSTKTEVDYRRVLRSMVEYLGATTPIAAITKGDVRTWRDALLAVRKHAKRHAPFSKLGARLVAKLLARETSAKWTASRKVAACEIPIVASISN